MRRGAVVTWTCLVEEALRGCDDFMDKQMLMKATGGSTNQVSAACHKLGEYGVIGVVINPDGKGWWYARPPEDDRRAFVRSERVPEQKPRKPRRKRAKTTFKPV